MQSIYTKIVAGVLLAGVGVPAFGQDVAAPPGPPAQNAPAFAVPRDPTNAALLYWRAWAIEPATLAEQVGKAYDPAAGVDPAGELAALLRENTASVEMILRATRLDACDFGVEYSQAFMALLPHLSKMRASARLLGASASLARAEGRIDDSVERVEGVYRLARHLRDEPVLISALVSAAVLRLAHDEARALAESGRLTPAHAARLVRAIDAFGAEDPVGIRRALRAEGALLADWAVRYADLPGAGDALADALAEAGLEDGEPAHLGVIRALDAQGVRGEARRVRVYYDAILDALGAPDAEARIADVAARAERLEYGPLVRAFGVSGENIRKGDADVRRRLRETRALLEPLRGPQAQEPR